MKKKFFLLIVLLLLCIVVVFLWSNYSKKKSEEEIRSDIEELTSFVSKEGKIQSKENVFSMDKPTDWYFRYELDYYKDTDVDLENFVGHVEIVSPELFEALNKDEEENIYNSKSGCLVDVGFSSQAKSFEEIKEEIINNNQFFESMTEDDFEVIKVAEKDALKVNAKSSSLGHAVGIFIPVQDGIYALTLFSSEENREVCSTEFEEILSTVLIK